MGMEERDWFREKRIDYEKGGLVHRNRKSSGDRPWGKVVVALGIATIIVLIGMIVYLLGV